MSIVGRRGSSGVGWTWSRPPSGPRRPPLRGILITLAGAVLIALLIALALVGVRLLDSGDNSPAGTSGTPTPTPAVTATLSPTATPGPTPSPKPSPSPVPTSVSPTPAGREPLFRLAAWEGKRWQFKPSLDGATYREGEAIPFLFRIDRASRGDGYSLTIRYDCEAFALLTSYDRDHGSQPALASGGPERATADTILSFPQAGTSTQSREAGSLSLWGGSFTGVDGPRPASGCTGEKSLIVKVVAASDTLYLMWAVEISSGATERKAPLRLTVQAAGAEKLSVEIDPESIRAAQP